MKTRILSLFVLISSVVVILFNLFAVLMPLNNQTTAEISNSFNVLFVPLGYIFSIWGLIYFLMLWASFAQLNIKNDFKHMNLFRFYFILSSWFNVLWLVFWHFNEPVLSVNPMIALLACLMLMFVIFFNNASTKNKLHRSYELLTGVYLGWITVAMVSNIAVALFVLEWNSFGVNPTFWSVALIMLVTLISIRILLKYKTIAFTIVIIWSLFGILFKSTNFPEVQLFCALSVTIQTFVIISVLRKKFIKEAI